ncbi:Ubiquitin system component cue protein [Thalictrum thalictroides]|uniref:Ubiquitin system component cue protein n=1 Tax=Thalictrum thalictroides TaxID=46969 RepID=A0A7J6WTB2_THATH|nr:Ubiquitin system component cue protein [Thalictrum thalictroides]
MSALVCGKRSYFEELPTSPLVSKRLRCSSISPSRLSPPRNYNPFVQSLSSDRDKTVNSPSAAAAIDHLRVLFPEMDRKLLERVLEESGDLESAIERLNELRLGSAEGNFTSATITTDLGSQEINCVGVASSEGLCASNLPKNGEEWVHLFVSEMTTASDMDDARARAARVLEVLEKSIRTQAGAEAANNLHKENMMMKEQMEVLMRDNGILKRAVAIQHDRQKEADTKNHELQHMKQLVAEYQERLKTLEVNNYALTMHLRQAQQSSSIPGRFHPDVF